VRHLLTHTSEGTPGTIHEYNGNRYGLLGGVIEGATGRTFADLLGERVLVPLGMKDTALNPINSWQGGPLQAFEDISRALGWGESFEHYPDVYDRLARPYQFDEQYQVIPGMYHRYHNPAAGLVSSASDLAKFDIALDQGALLDEATRTEMFTPMVQTVVGRDDLAYGLGWYVQNFDGVRLLWHTGRWPPSTSALYLKVPDLDLTFVVLANTDNLTVPFPGIGNGDLAHSILMLTFFHHYVFPELYGFELPSIDWEAGQLELVDRLTSSDDEVARLFLERELWSMRQAYAGSGQLEQADKLRRTGVTAFPASALQRDPNTTWTTGRSAIIQPLAGARAFMWLSRLVLAWMAILGGSLVWMLVLLLRSRRHSIWDGMVWMVATALVGPIAPMSQRNSDPVANGSRRAALLASLFCVTGYAIAWSLAIVLLIRLGDDSSPLATLGATLLIPLAVGLLLIRAPLLRRAGIRSYATAARRGLVAEIITLLVIVGVMFLGSFYVENRWLSNLPFPTSPFFGAMMSVLTLAGLAVLMPLHRILQRRGFAVWPADTGGADAVVVALPTLRDSWWMLLGAFGFMVGLLVLAVSRYS
ncbi:MAG: serine hydrolase, partial [Acidimicrobiia bacterium]|nr:serine hydrolase [Acidimicrobiia bacterium]